MTDNQKLISQFYVYLDGGFAPEGLVNDISSVTVENSLHLPDVATLIVHDPKLQWVDDNKLAPGKKLKITVKGDREEQEVFDGEIVEIESAFGTAIHELTVRAFDRLHRLNRGRHVRSFVNVTDGDLIKKVAQEVGLQAKVGPTTEVHPYVLQVNETNLQFLQQRAATLGYMLFVEGETLYCNKPEARKGTIKLRWGDTLGEFRPRMTTVGQVNSVMTRGWDPAKKQPVVGQAKNGNGVPKIGTGSSGGDLAKKAFNLEATDLVPGAIRTQAGAQLLAQAVADRHASRFVEAEGTCGGNPGIVAGASVEIDAVGDRFKGSYFVTSSIHSYHPNEGYTTQFNVSGLHPTTLLSMLTTDSEPSPTTSMVIGIVTDNQDPEGMGRVKVKYPWLSEEHASDWARVVIAGGSAKSGFQFLPEVNDEVLIGFEFGDIHAPYVLGGLWNGKDTPPQGNKQLLKGGKVQQRIVSSRTGHTITLDDDDAGGGIVIKDKAGNVVKLDTKSKAVIVESTGDLSLKAKGKMLLEATGQVEIKGMGLKADGGSAPTEIKGMSVKVDGGAGNVDVKGLVINLN